MRAFAKCHPDRLVAGRGMCNSCYKKWHYDTFHSVKLGRKVRKNVAAIPKCHPDRKHMAFGLCAKCYHKWAYYNVPGRLETHLASLVKAREKQEFKSEYNDIPRQREGFKTYKFNITAKETSSLNACLKRRGLARELSAMGGWRRAA